jgi:hypothetical protein
MIAIVGNFCPFSAKKIGAFLENQFNDPNEKLPHPQSRKWARKEEKGFEASS